MTPEQIRTAIATLEREGLIAATGTVIEKYSVSRPTGTYDYYRLCDSKGRFLIHLGNAKSEWYRLFREAVERRQRLTELKAMLKVASME
jgi:hypothetical protein